MEIIKIKIDFRHDRNELIKQRLKKMMKTSLIMLIKIFMLIMLYINLRKHLRKIMMIKYKMIMINITMISLRVISQKHFLLKIININIIDIKLFLATNYSLIYEKNVKSFL